MDEVEFVAKWGKVPETCEHDIPRLAMTDEKLPHCTQGYHEFSEGDDAPYPHLDPNCGDGWCDGRGRIKEVDWAEVDKRLQRYEAIIAILDAWNR